MRTLSGLVVVVLVACADTPPPSCQTAVTHYYGVGCTFVNISTTPATPYTLNESIVSCKQINSAVPDRCRSHFDDYVICLNDVPSSSSCTNCTQAQDALFACQ